MHATLVRLVECDQRSGPRDRVADKSAPTRVYYTLYSCRERSGASLPRRCSGEGVRGDGEWGVPFVIAGEDGAAEQLTASLVRAAFQVRTFQQPIAASIAARQRRPDVIVLVDVELASDADQLAAAQAIDQSRHGVVVVGANRIVPKVLDWIRRRFEGRIELVPSSGEAAHLEEAVRRVRRLTQRGRFNAVWTFELRHIASRRVVTAISRDGDSIEPARGFDEQLPWAEHAEAVRRACFEWSRQEFELLVTWVERARADDSS